ncbi:unnamed protein product, partial [Ilex paraguariensis]
GAGMSNPVKKRLMRNFKRLQKQDPRAGICGAPYDNNIRLWNVDILKYVRDFRMLAFIASN